jgi:hypothetical protein
MPNSKSTVNVADCDLAKSRENQLRQHGEEIGGKRDGYRTGNKPDVDSAGPTG